MTKVRYNKYNNSFILEVIKSLIATMTKIFNSKGDHIFHYASKIYFL